MTSSSCKGTTPPAQVPPPVTGTAPCHRRAGIRNAADGSAAGDTAAALRAFRGRDQLQKFLRIIQPLLEFRAQRLGRNLGCNADLAGRRIGRDKPYFVDPDRSCLAVPEGALDLFDHVLGPAIRPRRMPAPVG